MKTQQLMTTVEEQTQEIHRLRTQLEAIKNQYEEALQEVKDYYENILAMMPGHVYWQDANGTYLGCNDRQAKSVGLSSRSDIVGKTNHDFMESGVASFLDAINSRVVQTGESYRAEESIKIGNKYTTYLSNKAPLRNKHREIIGMLGISLDITERKKLENDLRIAKEKAEEANQLKIEFMRNMEHDIRTPFNGIYGIALMLQQRETEPEKKELLGCVVSSAKELLDYCNGVLDYSKIEMKSLPLLDKKFKLKELVHGVTVMEQPAIELKGLAFKLNFGDGIPSTLMGDEYRLQRILINLISNAIKFTSAGFIQLDVEVVRQEKRKILLKFILKDTGIGIPEDKQMLIYERFTRLDAANKAMHKGPGLGLRVIKQFIEEMKGEIDLISAPNRGTTFTCTLPFKLPLVETV